MTRQIPPPRRRISRAAILLTGLMLAILATPWLVWIVLGVRESLWQGEVSAMLAGRFDSEEAGSRAAVRRLANLLQANPRRRSFSARWEVADTAVLHGPPLIRTFQIDYDRHAHCLRVWRHGDTLHPLHYRPVTPEVIHRLAARGSLPSDLVGEGATSTYYGPTGAFSPLQ